MVFISRFFCRMIRLFEDKSLVSTYAQHRPTWPPEVAQRVVEYSMSLRGGCATKFESRPCAMVVDVGCGSGQSTPMYASFSDKILGLDPSEEQIKKARQQNGMENIEYKVAIGESVPLQDESADIICCAQSVHWLDYNKFLKECSRVLKPQGSLAVYGYTMAEITVPEERSPGQCNELFQNFFKQCEFHPRRKHVDNRLADFYETISSATKTREDTMQIMRDWSLTDLTGYIKSWSGYQKLAEKQQRPDLLGNLVTEILKAVGKENPDEISVKAVWSIFLILSSRPDR